MPLCLRLYIDESGDHSYRNVNQAQWDKRHLCLLGCAFDIDYYRTTFCPAFEELKSRHFGSDPDDPVVLHREDMVARRGPFGILRDKDKAEAFRADFLKLVDETSVRIFAVVIDKINTQPKQYGPIPFHPYHIGLLTLMERYCGWLNFMKATGDVLAESRGGREDLQLKAVYKAVHTGGTRYRATKFFTDVLTSKELKIKKKEENIAGLQIADLLAYPARRRILHEMGIGTPPTGMTEILAQHLEPKYNKQVYTGAVSGYGKIILR